MKKQPYDLEERLLIKKPELLDDILQETDELIKIFVTSIKTAVKKPRLGVVEYLVPESSLTWIFVFHSMLDVRCSTFIFQNNPGWHKCNLVYKIT